MVRTVPQILCGGANLGANCTAEVVQSYDTATTVVSTGVADDCTFTMETATGKAWGVQFLNGTEVIATMIFENGTARPDELVYYTGEEDAAIDLGLVMIAGTTAVPENEPAKQSDRDGDGFSDYDDGDDDNDGVLDIREADCDDDGILDDDDLANEGC